MRPIPRVWQTATISTAATEIRDSGLPAVGVTEGPFYVSIVTQESLTAALASGARPEDSVARAFHHGLPSLPPYATGQEALDFFTTQKVGAVAIVDDGNRLMGVLTPADLWPKSDRPLAPERVGGMATPFGVYLTTGTLGAGARGFALVATGMLMYTVLTLTQIASDYASLLTPDHWPLKSAVFGFLSVALFAAVFRLLPISGIHAAEHKVVHAIERGEPLTRESVRRMPRVHPRCGTNFAAGMSIFTAIAYSRWIPEDIRMVLALVGTLLLWRPVGSLLQYWVTTKEPTDQHLDMGIRSGEELLKSYASGTRGQRTVFGWIWNSGLLHVMGGMFLMVGIQWLLAVVFNVPYLLPQV